MIRVLAALFIASLVTAFSPAAPNAQENSYRIGTNDILSIRVYEWMAIDGMVREWPSMTGNYTVGPDGTISLPFVGRYGVESKTAEEIAQDLGEQLKQILALQDRPTAAVEIARYSPIFVGGYVESPGQYEYEPGLTVRKMVASAGGLERGDDGDLGLTRSVINSRGQLRLYDNQFLRQAVRMARIEAELSKADTLDAFIEVERSPAVDVMIADEQAIMVTRQRQLDREMLAIDRQKQILTSEIDSLEQKLVANERQLELARADMEQTKDLASRGLARQADVFDRERFLVDIESSVLDIGLSLLSARLNLERADRDIIALVDNRDAELALERQRLDAELKEIAERMQIENALLAETLQLSTEQAAELTDLDSLVVSYVIVRSDENGITEVAADLDSAILPGDVIDVRATPPTTQ